VVQNRPFRIAALGEILWDVFPSGRVFGGAPANFACSVAGIAGQHADVAIVSAVGHDELGEDAVVALREHQIETRLVQRLPQPTGRVDVDVLADGSASYTFAEDCAWDNLGWNSSLQEHLDLAHAVCFGSLGQRSQTSKSTIRKCVESASKGALIVFDINLRPPFYTDEVILSSLELCNVLKLNEDELPIVSKLAGVNGTDQERLAALADRFELKSIALTLGDRGSILFRDGEFSASSGVPTKVVDTVGAGDAFTAQFVLGL